MKSKLKKGLAMFMLFTLLLGMGIDAAAEEVTGDLNEMLTLVNNFRTGSDAWYYSPDGTTMNCTGLTALTVDPELQKIAMIRANELVQNFSHERPGGGYVTDDYNNVFGENIAYGSGELGTAASIFEGWKETADPYSGQGHRRNMLGVMYINDSPEEYTFTTIGIGHVRQNGADYWVQLFGGLTQWDTGAHITPAGTPEKPDTPDTPEEPGTPEGPGTPEDPGTPEKPEPGTPEKPGTTTKPGTSGGSGSSNDTETKVTYAITGGGASVWVKGNGNPLVITSNGDFSKFVSIEIDGAVVDKNNYEAWSGSTVVSLNAAFLDTLAAGEHTYRVNYVDGAVETTFTVNAAQEAAPSQTQAVNSASGNKAPQTGDHTTIMLSILMALVSVSSIVFAAILRKRA